MKELEREGGKEESGARDERRGRGEWVCVAHGLQSKKRLRVVEAKLGVWMSEMKRRKDRERGLQLW